MAKIQVKFEYGAVYEIHDFIDEVQHGYFSSWDEFGRFWDEEKKKETGFYVPWDIEQLEREALKYKYVIWYNK